MRAYATKKEAMEQADRMATPQKQIYVMAEKRKYRISNELNGRYVYWTNGTISKEWR